MEWRYVQTDQSLCMHDNALLGFFDILLATSNVYLSLLVCSLLLLSSVLVLVVVFIREVDLNSKGVAKLVNT